MASKRKIKKQIIDIASLLFEEALLLRAISDQNESDVLNDFMDDVMVFLDDSLRRAHNPDAKDNPLLLRAYYRKLREDINEAESAFNERLSRLAYNQD